MSNETVFYIVGIALVVMALAVSFVGLRLGDRFPGSRGVMGGVVGLFALVVLATAVFGWRNAEDEQAHKAEEAALAAEEAQETEGAAEEPELSAEAREGEAVFTGTAGCGGCHTLEAAGSTATIGPNLDGALADQSPDQIETSIVDPAAQVAEGFPPGIMPEDFAQQLDAEEIDALVQYLVEATAASSS